MSSRTYKLITGLLAAATVGLCALTASFREAAAPERLIGSRCVARENLHKPVTDDQMRLARLFRRASLSPTGSMLMNTLLREGTVTCLNRRLDSQGQYSFSGNVLDLHPNAGDNLLTATLVHEATHKLFQVRLAGRDQFTEGNIPENERVVVMWAGEANAELGAILFAHEMKERGFPQYAAAMEDDEYAGMTKAFREALAARPGDMREAMRAAILSFTDRTDLMDGYVEGQLRWIDIRKRHFRPGEPRETIVDDGNLRKLGGFFRYGNYMSPDFMEELRGSYTAEDYRAYLEARPPGR